LHKAHRRGIRPGDSRRIVGHAGTKLDATSLGCRMNRFRSLPRFIAFLCATGFLSGNAARAQVPAFAPASHFSPAKGEQTAVFAGGCFWGVDAVFKHVKGVSAVVSGYSGGGAATAHYAVVSTGTTGHAESVQITYDPSQISYSDLLRVFFSVAHDPTQLNRQGPDVGSQYRSAIFYANGDQRATAQAYIAQLGRAHGGVVARRQCETLEQPRFEAWRLRARQLDGPRSRPQHNQRLEPGDVVEEPAARREHPERMTLEFGGQRPAIALEHGVQLRREPVERGA